MTNEIKTVLCVLKSGGREYSAQNVHILQASLAKHSNAKLVCLSDIKVPCERIPLEYNWPGWWSKMELFKQVFDDSVLYVDLDTTFVDDPAPLWREDFTMLESIWKKGGLGSGIMSWKGDYRYLFEAFKKNPAKYIAEYKTNGKWGDQDFIRDHLGFVPKFFETSLAASYKGHCTDHLRKPFSIPHPDVRVVYFHGKPRPWQVQPVSKIIDTK